MWRRSNGHELVDENFHKFLASIARVYPPTDHDEMQAKDFSETRDGRIKQLHFGYQFSICQRKLISIEEVPNIDRTLRSVATAQLRYWKRI
ncbi:hypothetical protein TNCV_3063871 [Trichonephila clavipes]|nr:hypothetical protein TNCV_3063871 [Trichonephila clavipes]